MRRAARTGAVPEDVCVAAVGRSARLSSTPTVAPCPPPPRWQLFVRLPNEQTLTLCVAARDTVEDVKRQICSRHDGMCPATVYLVFGGKWLDNEAATLQDCRIEREATLLLRMRMARTRVRACFREPSIDAAEGYYSWWLVLDVFFAEHTLRTLYERFAAEFTRIGGSPPPLAEAALAVGTVIVWPGDLDVPLGILVASPRYADVMPFPEHETFLVVSWQPPARDTAAPGAGT